MNYAWTHDTLKYLEARFHVEAAEMREESNEAVSDFDSAKCLGSALAYDHAEGMVQGKLNELEINAESFGNSDLLLAAKGVLEYLQSNHQGKYWQDRLVAAIKKSTAKP